MAASASVIGCAIQLWRDLERRPDTIKSPYAKFGGEFGDPAGLAGAARNS
jgi:hypothetical protein